MADLTDERLAELEAMAKAATKGDWHEEDDCRPGLANACGAFRNYDINVHFACGPRVSTVEQAEADSRHIVAAQPKTTLALIAEVRRLREELDESRRLTPYRRGYEDALRGPEVARMTDRLAESQAVAAKLKEALRKVRKFDPGTCFCAVVADGCMNCILRAALAETEGSDG